MRKNAVLLRRRELSLLLLASYSARLSSRHITCALAFTAFPPGAAYDSFSTWLVCVCVEAPLLLIRFPFRTSLPTSQPGLIGHELCLRGQILRGTPDLKSLLSLCCSNLNILLSLCWVFSETAEPFWDYWALLRLLSFFWDCWVSPEFLLILLSLNWFWVHLYSWVSFESI